MENSRSEKERQTFAVSIAPCEEYERQQAGKALEAVLAPFGGISSFVHPGMKVAVKVNMVRAQDRDEAVITNPVLVGALCSMIREAGGTPLVGDSPGGVFTPAVLRSAYRKSGLDLVEKEGGLLNEDVSIKEAFFPGAARLRSFTYTGWLDGADLLIDFCKLKTHAMLKMTCAVKNLFGTIPGTRKPEYHMRFPDPESFSDMLVDLNEYFRPGLCLCDAVVCMEGNGPTSGTPRKLGALLASPSSYALDMVAADLIGFSPEEIATCVSAARRGLGPSGLSEISLLCSSTDAWDLEKSLRIPDFRSASGKRSITFRGEGATGRVFSAAAEKIFRADPQAEKKSCIGCGRCAADCPAGAIVMKNGHPDIDRKRCIHCFCCQEFCPVGAMKVKRTALARALEKLSGKRKADGEKSGI